MSGHHQHPALGHQERKLAIKGMAQLTVAVDSLRGQVQGVDHGIAGHERNALQTLAQHVAARLGGGSEQVIGNQIDATTVHLFRPWLTDVTGAQTSFDVADGDAAMKGRHGRHHG